ncbi:hypothetical protein KY336_02330 [Candidatus Woesearchaeota archaeon]|nr:hypothetical protein [Candidatus Woesearchaeota archaeon]
MAADLHELYHQDFKIKKLSAKQKSKFKKHSLKYFPAAVSIILHIITMGIFTIIFYGVQHGKFPKAHPKDFGTGKAIGFMFIPFFNYYWLFMFWLRMADRINFQFKLRNKTPRVEKGLVIATCVIQFIPYVGLLSYFVLFPIMIGFVQGGINELARIK